MPSLCCWLGLTRVPEAWKASLPKACFGVCIGQVPASSPGTWDKGKCLGRPGRGGRLLGLQGLCLVANLTDTTARISADADLE